MATPMAQLIYGFVKHDKKELIHGWQTTAGLVVATGITYTMKTAFNRHRPYSTYPEYIPYSRESSASFPSGHVSLAFSTATSLSLEYKRWYVAVPAYAWASGVGYSRLVLGVHYPSDVLAGALVGAASSWVTWRGQRWIAGRGARKNGLVKPEATAYRAD
jgi:undecaprenyl-diphosphatase